MPDESKPYRTAEVALFDGIARRIGRQLRDLYPHPETEPVPTEHIQMLLELRHKERNTARRGERS